MIWFTTALWLFIAAGMMWNNIYRRYTIGVYKWMVDTALPKLRSNEEWSAEADALEFDVMIDVDQHINESFAILLPLVIVLGINSALLLSSLSGELIQWMNFAMATGNAACAVAFLVLRKRYFWTKGQVEAYKALIHAEQIHTDSLKNFKQ
jgi:hypothetical protein